MTEIIEGDLPGIERQLDDVNDNPVRDVQRDPLAGGGFTQAAPQRTTARGISLRGQPVASLVRPDLLQCGRRDRLEDEPASGRSSSHDLLTSSLGHAG
jgi:hypothetical protein